MRLRIHRALNNFIDEDKVEEEVIQEELPMEDIFSTLDQEELPMEDIFSTLEQEEELEVDMKPMHDDVPVHDTKGVGNFKFDEDLLQAVPKEEFDVAATQSLKDGHLVLNASELTFVMVGMLCKTKTL